MSDNHHIQDVLSQLQTLEPGAQDAPRPASQALARLRAQVEAQQTVSVWQTIQARLQRPFRRPAFALALLLLFVTAFSFPPVRAAASDFLGLFRVQKFAPVSVSPQQVAILQQLAEEGLSPGQMRVVDEPGALTPVDTLSEAIAISGLSQVQTVPALGEPAQIYVVEGGSGRFQIDLDGMRAILDAAGADPALLPSTLADADVDVTFYPGIEQRWANGVTLMQMESPLVEYPAQVDAALLGQALLQLLGLTADEAARLARQIDWTSTLLLPIPADVATFNEVTVNGVSGVALNGVDGRHSAVMWQKDGCIYLLLTEDSSQDPLSLAESIE